MRRAALRGIVALMVFVAACGGRSGSNPDLAALSRGDVLMQVENDRWNSVTIYGVQGGAKFRIGRVSGMTDEAFWVPKGTYAGGSTVDYLLQPQGTRNSQVYGQYDRFPWGEYRYLLEGVPDVSGSDVIRLRLKPELGQSYMTFGGL